MTTHALRLLGLDVDADQRAIKRAYAAKLKSVRPDTDPEGFQRLHEAYREALRWCELRSASGPDEDEFDEAFAEDESADSGNDERRALGEEQSISPTTAANAFADSNEEDSRGEPSRDETPDDDATESNLDALFDDGLRTAFDPDRSRMRRWLHEQPALWSLEHKPTIGFWWLRLLEERLPPVPGQNFDELVEFFGYQDLHNGYDPLTLRRLREHLDAVWEQERSNLASADTAFTASAPTPWSAEASLTRARMREEHLAAEERRALYAKEHPNQRPVLGASRTPEERARAIERVAARDHRHLLEPPNRWRDLWLMALPFYSESVRAFLLETGDGDPQAIPQHFRPARVRYWLTAGDDRRWSWPRTQVALVRAVVWSAAIGLLVLAGAMSPKEGAEPALPLDLLPDIWLLAPLLFLAWLVIATLKSALYWQADTEPAQPPRRWAHRGFVPLLFAMSILASARSEIGVEAFHLGMMAMVAAIARHHGSRSPARMYGPQLPPQLSHPLTLIVFGLFMILLSDIIAVEEVALGILLGLWGVAAALWTQSLRLRRARR
ncbi:MAG: hypothetical protein KA144_14290 [Xanthomonadaceae bacterium]|nr:hypothetical protein [Xanthomonadaceae bacterium]